MKAYYILWRDEKGSVGGFIVEEDSESINDNIPQQFETKAEAYTAMKGHILESRMEVIYL